MSRLVVVATDPETGETVVREVTATIDGDGLKHLVEVTVDVDGDRGDATGAVTATGYHPFWVADPGAWTNARSTTQQPAYLNDVADPTLHDHGGRSGAR
jgi:hypothetical protein